jgi:hypothetical protein
MPKSAPPLSSRMKHVTILALRRDRLDWMAETLPRQKSNRIGEDFETKMYRDTPARYIFSLYCTQHVYF